MKGYLILDFTIKDFGSFKEYIDKIPEYIRSMVGVILCKALCQKQWKVIGLQKELLF
jgi:uncharacterized protein (DUF1330 family)